MIQSWSFQIQQQLATDLIASVAYVGNKSQNLRSAAADGMYNNMPVQDLALGQNVILAQVGSAAANAAGIFAPYPGSPGQSATLCAITHNTGVSTQIAALKTTGCRITIRCRPCCSAGSMPG